MKKALYISTFLIVFLTGTTVSAQEIDFGDYYNYTLTVAELNPGTDFEFGTIVSGSGSNVLTIANSKVITITGVKYLDVFVTVTADDELLLGGNPGCVGDPSCSIDFELEAAYANRGSNNIGQARIFSVTANSGTAQFPIKYRTTAPPSPPPTPVYEGYNPAAFNETAYLYIYGSLSVGTVNAGSYTGNIDVTLIYD